MRTAPCLVLAAILTGSFSPPAAKAQDAPAAVIIIDGSGSMAGWLDGAKASKIDMARTALSQELGKLPPPTAIGLVAFGHRRKGNCTDVETLTPPQPDALAKTLAALPGISPTGKGPLVQALRQAAATLSPGPARSIVVLHDDADNCNQDACEAATAIAKSHPGLTINVITIGPKPATKAAMSCVPAATGGRSFEVGNEAELSAAVSESLKVAGLDPNVPAPKPASRPDTSVAGQPGLTLTATLTANGDALTTPVHWRIRKEGDSGPPLVDTMSPGLSQLVPSGTYLVEAQAGLAKAKQTITVSDGKPSVAQLNLEAGLVKFAPDAARQSLELLTVLQLNGSEMTPVYVGRNPGGSFILPAGNYDLRLDDGLGKLTAKVNLAPGNSVTVGQPNASGRLELEALSAENGPPVEGVSYMIEQDDPDAPQGRREIARSAAPRPDFTLPAGTYYITAKSRQAEVRQRLAVSAGASVKQTMILALSQLTLNARVNASSSPQAEALNFRVLALDGTPREVARSAAAAPVLTLPAGRYRIEATLGSGNAKASSETDLAAGKDAAVTLDIAAGEIRLDQADASTDTIIEVMDDKGTVVWHAGKGSAAAALLAPGRYRYRTPDGVEKTFDVKAGERLTLRSR